MGSNSDIAGYPALSPDGGEGETTSVIGQLAGYSWQEHLQCFSLT